MDSNLEKRVYTLSKTEFFEEWMKYGKDDRNKSLFQFISSRYDLQGITEPSERNLKQLISRLSSKISTKWETNGRNSVRFRDQCSSWLQENIVIEVMAHLPEPSSSTQTTFPGPGRPQKDFEDASFKTKKRRVDDLVKSRSASELAVAAQVAARLEGHRNVAHIIKDVSESPEKCAVAKKRLSSGGSDSTGRCLTKEEALAYYVDSKSTSHSYKQTRKWSMKAGHQVFPSMYCVRQAKLDCFPREDQITLDESRAEIKLQAILDKTIERLVTVQSDVLSNLSSSSSFTLISKWGCDGSSGHSTYKQKFSNSEATDEFLFVFSFVPIQLRDVSGNIVWQNPRPSSSMNFRPIKFIFSKESTDLTLTETNSVLEEINSLRPTKSSVDGREITVKHELLFTMIDGKVCNAVTETASSQTCYICKATPKLMNDESREFVANKDNLGFGLSTLHAWIRCFECLLHISYRLEIKKWQVRGKDDQAKVKQRSEDIRQKFKAEMGLNIDKPKPGYGNTNDGNTARRFFGDPEKSAEITGLDVNLIKMFDTILRALSSGYDINIDKFVEFTQNTRKLYLSLYSWYYMPATIHKILVHGADIIRSALLPIGQLSEKAQEARNKDCRRFRQNNTRKQSRIATNRDLLNMLIITSDPVINSLREIPKKKTGSLPSEVMSLLLPPNVTAIRSIGTRISEDYVVDDSSEDEFSD